MALNFPSNPAAQTPTNTFSPTSSPDATTNGATYIWNGTAWTGSVDGAGASIITSATFPSVAEQNDLLFNSDDGKLYIYYKDADSSQWVDTAPVVGETGSDGASVTTSPNPPSGPEPGDLWFNSDDGRLYVYYEDVDGSQWVDASPDAQAAVVSSSPSPPSSPNANDLWWDDEDGKLFIYYVDADSSQWVEASPSSGGSNYVAIDGDTMTGDLTVPSLNTGPLAGLRNVLINGDFRISQRGGPFLNATTDTYTFDRWTYQGGTANVEAWPSNQSQDGFEGVGLRATSATSVLQGFAQIVETQNCKYFYGKTITVSCYASVAPVLKVTRQNSDSTYTTVTNNVAMNDLGSVGAGNLNYYSLSVDIPAAQIGESNGDFFVNNGFGLRFDILATSTVFDLYNCQVELGPIATPFEQRPIALELSLCQRYYEESSLQRKFWSDSNTASARFVFIEFQVKKRAAPTVTAVDSTTADSTSDYGTPQYLTDGFSMAKKSGGGDGSSWSYRIISWEADAEL